ncbi:centromere protein P isoform X3 [Hyla sarda]|uniref:centromere protein P isoform X3 n=1 Tax=Hyla sarda TaxID=327740 RepID=UPI0024C3D392|nr:centromere protein P isoform X3 [Hyla sarda]
MNDLLVYCADLWKPQRWLQFIIVPNMQRDIIERCEDAISALKQELQELQEKYEENKKEITFLSSTNIKKALVSFYGKSSNDDSTNLKNIQSKLVKCEQEIQFFRTVTGMEFTKYLKKTETKTEKGTIYSHRLVGCCRFLPFEVEFKTLDAQTKSCEVIHINIHVDQKENSDLVKLVSRTHKSLNLLGFFRTISTYTEWFDYRQSTFSQFKISPLRRYLRPVPPLLLASGFLGSKRHGAGSVSPAELMSRLGQ